MIRWSVSTVISALRPFAFTRQRPVSLPSFSTAPGLATGRKRRFSQLRIRREQGPVGPLEVGIPGWNQADALRVRGRVELIGVFANDPALSPRAPGNFGELVPHSFPAAARVRLRQTGPVGEVADGRRPIEAQKALDGIARLRCRARATEHVAAGGVEPERENLLGIHRVDATRRLSPRAHQRRNPGWSSPEELPLLEQLMGGGMFVGDEGRLVRALGPFQEPVTEGETQLPWQVLEGEVPEGV